MGYVEKMLSQCFSVTLICVGFKQELDLRLTVALLKRPFAFGQVVLQKHPTRPPRPSVVTISNLPCIPWIDKRLLD